MYRKSPVPFPAIEIKVGLERGYCPLLSVDAGPVADTLQATTQRCEQTSNSRSVVVVARLDVRYGHYDGPLEQVMLSWIALCSLGVTDGHMNFKIKFGVLAFVKVHLNIDVGKL
jgi:hypothetical protein